MNYLVDTHVAVWSIVSSDKISKKASKIILDAENTKLVSVISFWEISLKFSLGKVDMDGILPDELHQRVKEAGFEILGLDSHIASTFYKLPQIKNKDPFDRMLAWQAICNNITLLTKDSDFAQYKNQGLRTIW